MSDFAKRLLDNQKKSHDGSELLDRHPELAGRVHVVRAGEGNTEIPAAMNHEKKAGYYSGRQWVNRAINIWADNIGPLNVRVVEGSEHKEINHDLNHVLQMPNNEMDSAAFWKEWAIELGFAGEFGIQLSFKTGDMNRETSAPNPTAVPVEMWPRPGEQLTVRTGPTGKRFRKVLFYILDDGEEPNEIEIPANELIFYKFYNPLEVFRGLSRLTAARLSVEIDFLSQLWSQQFFNNSARPDYALITPEGVTETEKKEILQDLWNRFRGVKKSHLPMILEKGITDIKVLSFPPKDLAWMEQRKMARDEIGAVYGIPDEIMGFGKDTFENFATADRVLWTNTLKPLTDFRDNMLTWYFKKARPILKPDQFIKTDLSDVSQLHEDMSERIDQWDTLVGKGVPPRTAADMLFLPMPEYNGDDIGYVPALSIPATSAKGLLGGPRIKLERIRTRRQATHWLEETRKDAEPDETASLFPEFGSDEHKAIIEARQNLLFPFQAKMAAELKKYFQRQQTEMFARLRSTDGRSFGRGKWRGKQEDDVPNIDVLFPLQKEVARFKKDMEPIIEESFMLVANTWWDELDQDGQVEITQVIENSISFITDFQAREVNKTTFNELARIFIDAEMEGASIPEIQDQLSAFWVGRKSAFETERIARTTMVAADNAGSLAAWDQSGVVKTRIWISALLPNRTRDAHAETHGQEVGLDQMFEVGGEKLLFPGDPNGSAGNIINCLCVTIPGKVEV